MVRNCWIVMDHFFFREKIMTSANLYTVKYKQCCHNFSSSYLIIWYTRWRKIRGEGGELGVTIIKWSPHTHTHPRMGRDMTAGETILWGASDSSGTISAGPKIPIHILGCFWWLVLSQNIPDIYTDLDTYTDTYDTYID